MKHLVLAAALLTGTAHATFYDGNDLLNRMDSDNPQHRMLALGYVAGVADSVRGRDSCHPDNVTTGQIRDLIRNYLTNNPADRHYSANSIVREVLKSVFPCSRGGKSL